MSFSWATAVAGTGTVSCTGTTTVTGTGTDFGNANSAAREGGTIIVGGVTKNIVTVVSTTQLITDTAFGTFTGSTYTCNREVVQVSTDTMGTSLGVITGFNVTNRGDQQRTFDARGVNLTINGVLTVDSTTGQLRNNSVNSQIKIASTGSASAELIINGKKSSANNGPFPYAGFDWLGVNGSKVMQLQGTAAYPAKLTLNDACIRFGADWLTTNSGQYSTITTQGDICWILCANGSGTNQARIRQDNTTASINFTARKTYVGVWLNFGVPQVSLKGYTPIYTDGPEINLASVSVAQRITIEDYDTTYITPAYYAGSQLNLYGGAWVRLKNNLAGTNISWQSIAPSNRNVLEFSKQITAKALDTIGTSLSDGYMYYQPVGSNVAGIRTKGNTTDITFDLTQQSTLYTSGTASSEFVYAWAYDNTAGLRSAYNYFCSGTTPGSESHTFNSSRYGYDKQTTQITLAGNSPATPTFIHVSLPTTDKIIANAAALTGLQYNFSTKAIVISGNNTVQTTYDKYQFELNQIANLPQPNECVVNNARTFYSGWSMTINSGVTLNTSTQLSEIAATSITNNGIITGITNWTGSFPFITSGSGSILNLNRAIVNWTPSAYADQIRIGSGGTLNVTNGTILTVSPTTTLGYGTAATAMFRSGSTLNMSNSTFVYNVVNSGSGTFFSNSEAGATWNITNSVWTLNCANAAQIAIHAYFLPTSVINGWTINGTATNVVFQMGFTTNNSKMVNFTYGGAIFGNGTSNCLMDTYTYTGTDVTIPSSFGSSNKWYWVDPVMSNNGLFRWNAGSTPTGNSGFYGVIAFRPTIKVDKVNFTPKIRFKASTLNSRYPNITVTTTEFSTLPLSNFFRDPTFMDSSDGYLPFVDSLDDKTVIHEIDWTVETRQAGWVDQTFLFTAAAAKKNQVIKTISGITDNSYVNSSTAAADMSLINVDTNAKVISSVTGNLQWSPQRLYNALKNWWSSYNSDVDFLSLTSNNVLNLNDYSVNATIKFITGLNSDVLTEVKTTGIVSATPQGVNVTDSRGKSYQLSFTNL